MNPLLLMLVLLLPLSGCTHRIIATEEEQIDAGMPIYCQDEECNKAWDSAARYITDHALLDLEAVDQHVIKTIERPPGDARLTIRIQRETMPNPAYSQIWVETSCDNMFGCVPDAIIEQAKIKRLMKRESASRKNPQDVIK